jgi:DNA-binding MarR family transcriptional regulator
MNGLDGDMDYGTLNAAIIRLGRTHRALAVQLMQEVGLRPDQGALMIYLWSVGPVRQTALAAHFGRDSAATTRAVQRLEHAGFLRRRTDPTDGRATLVEPTEAGDALRPSVARVWEQLERITTTGLAGTDLATALEVVTRLGDTTSAALAGEPPSSLGDV